MDGIPPASDTDAEDVVWALQTAEALWKRNERGDAIVWLRRAAQAAGEANDDDRALLLAREAAELTEWFAHSSSTTLETIPPVTEGSVSGVAIDFLLRASQLDPSEVAPISIAQAELVPASEVIAPGILAPPDLPEPAIDEAGRASVELPPAAVVRSPSQPVPSAAESHAGMLDPWSDTQEPSKASAGWALAPTVGSAESESSADRVSEESVVTSAPIEHAGGIPPAPPGVKPPPLLPALPPPLPPALPPPLPPPADPLPEAPPAAAKAPPRAAKPPTPPRSKSQELPATAPRPAKDKAPRPRPPALPSAYAEPPPPPPVAAAPESEPPIQALDLSTVEAFADLPDDSRDRLARDSVVKRCSKGDAIEAFSLVFVMSGEAHVMASGAASQATTIGKGTVLLARGTLDTTIGLSLVCSSPKAVIATWDAAAVEAALGSCPWVEDELRVTGDRVQALAGASLGALGERLSPDLRAGIVEKMTMRTFAEHETIVTEGLPVPGILLVAVGNVDLVANQVVTTQVTAGHFVLPAEALSAAPSPASARAAAGGALVFAADRKTSQELFATEPLLLELFAGW